MRMFGRRLEARVRWSRLPRILRALAPVLKEEQKSLSAGLLGAVGVALMEIARPWPLKAIVDFALLGREARGAWESAGTWMAANPGTTLLLGAGALVGTAGVRSAAAYLENVAFSTAAQRLVWRIRCRLFSHLQRLSIDFHDTHPTGDLLTRLTGDVDLVSEVLSGSILALGSTLFLLAGTGIVLARMDPVLTLAALSVVPLLFAALSRLTWKLRGAVRHQRRNESKLVTTIHEVLKASRIVQVFGREEAESRGFDRTGRRALRAGLAVRRLQVAVQAVTMVILAAGTGIVLVLGSRRVAAGQLSPGDLIVFLAYLESTRRPVTRLTKRLARITKAVACGERIVSVLERWPRVRDEPDAREAPALRGEIEVERVTFGYRDDQRALRRVSFRVRPGERVVLVGPSGSGKSSIVNILLRFYDPLRGRVLVDGTDVRRFRIASLRGQMSALLQEPLLFGLSVHENIALGSPLASREAVREAAETAQAHAFVERLPTGYDTRIGEEGCTLSGGEQRLLAIARAILRGTPILILDEPAAGLDAETESRMQAAIREVTKGRTTIVIAHRLASVLDADRILYLHKGKIRAEGTHRELYGNCDGYRRICDLQFGPRVRPARPRRVRAEVS